jgi:cytochrome c biogenesis protein CcmG/thiol:disulfide interchange protein DsbE
MRRGLGTLLAVAIVLVVIAIELLSSGSGERARPAPPLPLSVLQPPRATLESLRGEPSLINFWASWCGPCREEAPELERFYATLHGAHLVGVDYTDQTAPGRAFIRHYGWKFPVLEDPDGSYGTRYHLIGLPTTVVLDSRGRIVEMLSGPQTRADLERALDVAGLPRG